MKFNRISSTINRWWNYAIVKEAYDEMNDTSTSIDTARLTLTLTPCPYSIATSSKRITAECNKDNQYSIRILKKGGAKVKTYEGGFLKWEIGK